MATKKPSKRSEEMFEFLQDTIRYKAEWRSEKAVEYPDDERNARSADALEQLNTWLGAHPTNPAVKRLIAALEGADPDAYGSFQPDLDERLARYAFHHHDEEPEAFIEELAARVREHLERR